jgi:hypothetical protein
MTHRYISSSTHTPKCRRVCKRKHSIGGPIPVKKASLFLARICTPPEAPAAKALFQLPEGLARYWPYFPATYICSLDPAVMRLAFGHLDRSLSLSEDGSESYRSFNWRGGFRDVPFGLSFLFSHCASDNTARTKILDRTPYRNCEQLDRLCNWIANVTAWLYSSKPILHLRIRVQHAAMAQGTNTLKSSSGAGTR